LSLEERRLRRVSKDEARTSTAWFARRREASSGDARKSALLTMRGEIYFCG
jgi:hypothetical protein